MYTQPPSFSFLIPINHSESQNKPFTESVKCDVTFDKPLPHLFWQTLSYLQRPRPEWAAHNPRLSSRYSIWKQHSSEKYLLIEAINVIQSRAVSDFLFLLYCLGHINSVDSSRYCILCYSHTDEGITFCATTAIQFFDSSVGRVEDCRWYVGYP